MFHFELVLFITNIFVYLMVTVEKHVAVLVPLKAILLILLAKWNLKKNRHQSSAIKWQMIMSAQNNVCGMPLINHHQITA